MSQPSLTRVELHGATPADYEKLHAIMAEKNFLRTIRNDGDGRSHQLPTATYFLAAAEDVKVEYIRDYAAWTITPFWKDFEVVVSLGPISWHNLPPAST